MTNHNRETANKCMYGVPTYRNRAGAVLRIARRIRDVSITRLAQIVIDKIAEDKLIEAVLDDAGKHQRTKNERRHRGYAP